eukprot:3886462-Prymnesium_polylepis.1
MDGAERRGVPRPPTHSSWHAHVRPTHEVTRMTHMPLYVLTKRPGDTRRLVLMGHRAGRVPAGIPR